MPVEQVEFDEKWYGKFIDSTNEKNLLVDKTKDLLERKQANSCLEIGLGISPYFAEKLSKLFKRYVIIERRKFNDSLPEGVELVNGDWETTKFNEKFDVILASHVIYYFKNKKRAMQKMLTCLNKGGRIFIAVNGKTSDYGPLKYAFAKMIGTTYDFTYDELLKILEGTQYKEYTLPSVIQFKSYEELFDTLRLSFDAYPEEYEENKTAVIDYLKKNVEGNKFIIDQKIIEVVK